MILCKKGTLVPQESCTSKVLDAHTLRFKTRAGKKLIDHEFRYYDYYKSYIVLPRKNINYSKCLLKKRNIKHDIESTVELRHNQKIIVDYIYNLFNGYIEEDGIPKRTSAILIADTGFGKSILGTALIQLFKQKTLFVVHNEKAVHSISDTIKKYTNLSVGYMYGKAKNDPADHDVIVGIIHTLVKQPQEWFKFGMVIYDEVPSYFTPTFKKIFFKSVCYYSIGMTAMPEKDTYRKAHESLVGPYIETTKLPNYQKSEEITFEGEVRIINYAGTTEEVKGAFNNYNSAILTYKNLYKDETRTAVVIQEILLALDNGNNIYIFSELNSYLDHIFYKIKPYKFKMTKLIGGSCQDDHDDAIDSRIIFTNYAYGEKALSIAHMDSLLYLTPRKSGSFQSTGRTIRSDGDNTKMRRIIDICDTNLFVKKQLPVRLETYKKRKFPIKYYSYTTCCELTKSQKTIIRVLNRNVSYIAIKRILYYSTNGLYF